ncbi:MAG: YraN family protein [Hyphomonadaceae bacterium]
MTRARRRAERRGRAAELIAALWLIAKGYRILGRRVRTRFGEVVLAALKRGVLVIVEVKARATRAAGLEAVAPMQQARLERAAQALAGRWRMMKAPIRFDVVIVGAGLWPQHVPGAWFARA